MQVCRGAHFGDVCSPGLIVADQGTKVHSRMGTHLSDRGEWEKVHAYRISVVHV